MRSIRQESTEMIDDMEIKTGDFAPLAQQFADIEAETCITLLQREPFDYTQWRQQLDRDLSIREISDRAMAMRLARRGKGMAA